MAFLITSVRRLPNCLTRVGRSWSRAIHMHTDFHKTIDGHLPIARECRYGVNPATGETSEPGPMSTHDDVEMAMSAAKKASMSWGKFPCEERRRCLLEFSEAIESHRDKFASLLTREQGKPVSQPLQIYFTACDRLYLLRFLSLDYR
jgi:acyl-CoA reductase-like NAD-dependent aldehyde dehydrogenase